MLPDQTVFLYYALLALIYGLPAVIIFSWLIIRAVGLRRREKDINKIIRHYADRLPDD